MPGELGFHRFDQVFIGVAVLQTARFRNAQHTFQVATPRSTLRSKAQLAVDHCRSKGALGRIVGRFNALHSRERP